jgi:hypothetical protein
MAISRAIAFFKSRKTGNRARQYALIILLVITFGDLNNPGDPLQEKAFRGPSGVASTEPLPGKERPSASVRQFIELAVNIPEQEPQVGQAERS